MVVEGKGTWGPGGCAALFGPGGCAALFGSLRCARFSARGGLRPRFSDSSL
jgi:hypothetical protein